MRPGYKWVSHLGSQERGSAWVIKEFENRPPTRKKDHGHADMGLIGLPREEKTLHTQQIAPYRTRPTVVNGCARCLSGFRNSPYNAAQMRHTAVDGQKLNWPTRVGRCPPKSHLARALWLNARSNFCMSPGSCFRLGSEKPGQSVHCSSGYTHSMQIRPTLVTLD